MCFVVRYRVWGHGAAAAAWDLPFFEPTAVQFPMIIHLLKTAHGSI